MGIFTRLDPADIQTLLAPYGLSLIRADGVRAGTVNTYYRLETNRGIFYLRIDERGDEGAVKQELHLLKQLENFLVPHPIPTQDGALYISYHNKPAILFTPLRGAPIRANKISHSQLAQIGNWLATLHAVRSSSLPLHRFHVDYLRAIYLSMQKRARAEAPETIALIENALSASLYTFPGLPECIIHADLFSENLHFDKGRLVGVLDFEAAGRGPRLLDLAIAMQALCFDLQKNRFDLAKAKALADAYLKRIALTAEEKSAWPDVVHYSALRFLVTRLKDFEFSDLKPHEGVKKDYREYLAHLSDNHRLLTIFAPPM